LNISLDTDFKTGAEFSKRSWGLVAGAKSSVCWRAVGCTMRDHGNGDGVLGWGAVSCFPPSPGHPQDALGARPHSGISGVDMSLGTVSLLS